MVAMYHRKEQDGYEYGIRSDDYDIEKISVSVTEPGKKKRNETMGVLFIVIQASLL